MIDFLLGARQALIENFQTSMKAVRLLMGYSIIDMAEYVGVTRQTINNLESGKSKMSVTQFLSLAAVVDNYIAMNGDMYQAIEAILDGNKKRISSYENASFSGCSLLRRWFLLFEGMGAELELDSELSLDSNQVQQMVHGYKIFFDDTALIFEKAEVFFSTWANYLIAENEKVIIPLKTIERVQELTQDTTFSRQAVKALQMLNRFQLKNLIEIRGEESDANLHDTILSVFIKFREAYRLCLVTQDEEFAAEVLRLNETGSGRGFNIVVGHINDNGAFAMYDFSEENPQLSKSTVADKQAEGFPNEVDTNLKSNEDKLIGWESL